MLFSRLLRNDEVRLFSIICLIACCSYQVQSIIITWLDFLNLIVCVTSYHTTCPILVYDILARNQLISWIEDIQSHQLILVNQTEQILLNCNHVV